MRWTKTAGSASDKFQETSIYNETLRIEGIQRVQGGRYYCKADNGVGVAAIKSIRVDVQCKSAGNAAIDPSTAPLKYYQNKSFPELWAGIVVHFKMGICSPGVSMGDI